MAKMLGNIGFNEIDVFLILKRKTLTCHLVLHKSNVVLLLCLIEYYMESRKAKYIFPHLLLVTVVNLYISLSVDAMQNSCYERVSYFML
jgi:hypothetical protein